MHSYMDKSLCLVSHEDGVQICVIFLKVCDWCLVTICMIGL